MSENRGTGTTTGIAENVAALLCYLLGWVTGIVFLVVEKENRVVRFHAVQSIVVFGSYNVAAIVLGFIPLMGWVANALLGVAAFIVWVILMLNAYQGKMVKLPVAGSIAHNQVGL